VKAREDLLLALAVVLAGMALLAALLLTLGGS